jgi:hypothetical protein
MSYGLKYHNPEAIFIVALGGLVVAWLPLDPKFVGSNLAEDDGFLRVIKSVARLPSEGK